MIVLVAAVFLIAEILLIIFAPVAGWSVLGFLGIILLFVLFAPLGIHASYYKEETFLALRIAFVDFKLIPKKVKTKTRAVKAKAQKEQAEQEPQEKTKKKIKLTFDFEELLELAKKAIKSLGKFGKLTVNKFLLHYTAAGNDPYKTAMLFGYINAALSSLAPLCLKHMRVKDDVDVWTQIDFTIEKPLIDAELIITLRLMQLIRVATVFAFGFLCILIRNKRRLVNEGKQLKAKQLHNNVDIEKNDTETTIKKEERM